MIIVDIIAIVDIIVDIMASQAIPNMDVCENPYRQRSPQRK